MVTAAAVWEALGEIPDPEIPVISVVDLGVVKDVAVDGRRVRVHEIASGFRDSRLSPRRGGGTDLSAHLEFRSVTWPA